MKQNLPNVDHLTVKYALDDMEPAESQILQAAMRDDQDLLIEAESQRRIWQRISALPTLSAPSGLLEDTVRVAVAARRKPQARILAISSPWRWAAAACIVAVVSLSVMRSGNDSALVLPAAAGSETSSEPWVDNRDVIRLQAPGGATAASAPVSKDSVSKLVPINPDNPAGTSSTTRQVQLTGSQRTP